MAAAAASVSTPLVGGETPSTSQAPDVDETPKTKKKRGRPPIDKSIVTNKHVKKQMKKIMEMVKHYTDR